MCLHPSMSLNNEKICREISEDKITVREVFGFELNVFESVSSHKNISVPRHTQRKPFSRQFSRSQQTA